MSEATCSVCGSSYGTSAGDIKTARPVCPSCQDKLRSDKEGKEGRQATVVRPVVAPRRASIDSPPASGSTLITDIISESGASNFDIEMNEPSATQGVPDRPALVEKSTPQATPTVGKIFGDYEILSEVNRGSFGVVYRARQKGLDRVVALKVLLAGSHASPEAVARFHREARAVARLKHPCIVPVFEIGMQDGHHYFAMEFIEGDGLSNLISRGEVSIPQALELAEQFADAIHSAHGEGVIHRDIKPSNIIVDKEGRPHITDFGLAKQVNLDTQYTQSGTTLGTPAYMPPEQARGEVESIDARSDVYALGAVLYEMLTGRAPFAGRSLLEVVVAVINEPIRPPRQINPKIHHDIQTIVMKCLEKVPKNRYATAAELRDDIRRFRSGEAIRARPVGAVRRGARYLARHGYFIGAAASVCIALTYLIWQGKEFQRKQDQLRIERQQQELAERQKRQEEEEKKRQEEEEATRTYTKVVWEYDARKPDPPPTETADPKAPKPARGFVPAPPRRSVLDLVDNRTRKMYPRNHLTSPHDKEILGSFDAILRFSLDEKAAQKGVRIGMQSSEHSKPIIPFVLSVRPGKLTLVGPDDLFAWEMGGKMLLLKAKAAKAGPVLVPGEYAVRVRRDGSLLRFNLTGPTMGTAAELCVWDPGLSHWIMKRVVLSIRDIPTGFAILSCKVVQETLPQKMEAIATAKDSFYKGEYREAESRFEDIVKVRGNRPEEERTPDDYMKLAEAHYYLGLIKEIYQPLEPRVNRARRKANAEKAPYTTEDRPWNLFRAAMKQVEKCENTPESRALSSKVMFRLLVREFGLGWWERTKQDVEVVASFQDTLALFPEKGDGLREPYGWELIPLVRMAVPSRPTRVKIHNKTRVNWSPSKRTHRHELHSRLRQMGYDLDEQDLLVVYRNMKDMIEKGTKLTATDMDVLVRELVPEPDYELALSLFLNFGLPYSLSALDGSANRVSRYLAEKGRGEELKSVQMAYPNEGNLHAFARLIKDQIREHEFEDALAFLTFTHEQFRSPQRNELISASCLDLMKQSIQARQYLTARKAMERFPSPVLVATLGHALGELARQPLDTETEELEKITALLKEAGKVQPREKAQFAELVKGCLALCNALVDSGHPIAVRTIHEAFDDPRLAPAFARAVMALIEAEDPTSEKDALDLLRYCRDRIPPGDKKLDAAAYALAVPPDAPSEGYKDSHARILKVLEAYPAPLLLSLAGKVLQELTKDEQWFLAFFFFKEARLAYRGGGATLRHYGVAALNGMEDSARTKKLEELNGALMRALAEDPPKRRQWQLEFADIQMALDRVDEANEIYLTLHEAEETEPGVRALVTLRLGALRTVREPQSADVMWNQLVYGGTDETALVGSFLKKDISYNALLKKRQKLKPPRLLGDPEWALIQVMGMRARGEDYLKALTAADQLAERTRSWCAPILRHFSPSEPKETPDPKTPAPPKTPSTPEK